MALIPKNDKPEQDKKAQAQAAQEDALLREIDDAVRQDQYADFAKNYGKPLIGALVLGLAAFGGYLWWDHEKEAAKEASSEAIVKSLDNLQADNLKAGGEELAPVAKDGSPGAKAVALMLQAGIADKEGKAADAAKMFAAVAADPATPPALRDLATLREIAANFDNMKPEEVIARLKPLAVPGKPFFGSAGEMTAMALLEQGKKKEAGALFAQISKDKDVPETMRSRTRQMAGLLGVDAIEDVDKLLKEESDQQKAASAQQ